MMSGDQKLISCHSACELQLEIPVFETESPGILILDVFKYLGLQVLICLALVHGFLVSIESLAHIKMLNNLIF